MFEMILSLNCAQFPAALWALLFDCGRFDVVLLFNSFVLDSLGELKVLAGARDFLSDCGTDPASYLPGFGSALPECKMAGA